MRIRYSVCYNYFGDTMKDLFKIIFMICLVLIVYLFRDNISTFIVDEIIYKGSNSVLTYNEYYNDHDFLYVQNIDKNYVENYNEVLNMFYSIINSGDDSFSFRCKYENCMTDITNLIDEKEIIANINNFVHPYNSYANINIKTKGDKITVKINKAYNEKQIEYINNYIDNFINNNIDDSMSNYDKIKLFHDYVVNNTVYDENNKSTSYSSYAYDLITTGKSICGGYSDIMSIYLNKLGLLNYKITSPNHVWNFVNLDNTWYHIDVTWDDPVASDGKQYLIHNFFMISTEELLKLDEIEHNFNKDIYLEAK